MNNTSKQSKNKSVAKYDFANPQKISKEQLRALKNIYAVYCKSLAALLTGYLRIPVDAEVISAKQVTYSDFAKALTNPCILSVVDILPLEGSIIQELSANVGYAIIDKILGGSGANTIPLGNFSEIEISLLQKKVAPLMLMPLSNAWEGVMPIKPLLQSIETNSRAAQIIPASDAIVLVEMSIAVGGVEGYMQLCMPIDAIKPIFYKLAKESKVVKIDDNKDAATDVVAVIGRVRMKVSDFANLAVDDIIPLDSHIDSDLEVFVGSVKKFHAKPGTSRGKNAIQITSTIEMEE